MNHNKYYGDSGLRISAFKPYADGVSQACEYDDPEASKFKVHYPGMTFQSSTLDFVNRLQDEDVAQAMFDVYEAGKKARNREFREFIGIRG